MTAAELDRHRYMSLATFRRTGAQVATPVWFAAVDGRLYVVSAGSSGKVKRLRYARKVTVQACGPTGRPRRGSAPVGGRAEILIGRAAKAAAAPLREKYGIQYKLGRAAERLFGERGHVLLLRITTSGNRWRCPSAAELHRGWDWRW